MRNPVETQSNLVVLGDKGYVGENHTQEMEEKGICPIALKRSNSKKNWTKPVRQLIFKLRRRAETLFFMKPVNLEKLNRSSSDF